MKKIIPNGTKFVRLTVLGVSELIPGRGYTYQCKCDCPKGAEIVVRGDQLRDGTVQSCGCLHDELLRENVKKAYAKNFVGGTHIPKISATKPQTNNTSGVRGVSWHRGERKWYVRIMFQGKSHSLGYFDSLDEAKRVREEAEAKFFKPVIERGKKGE